MDGRNDRGLAFGGSRGGFGDGSSGAVVADGDDGRSGRLDDGASAGTVGDGQGRGLADGVGLAGVSDLSRLRAVCRVRSQNYLRSVQVRDCSFAVGSSPSVT